MNKNSWEKIRCVSIYCLKVTDWRFISVNQRTKCERKSPPALNLNNVIALISINLYIQWKLCSVHLHLITFYISFVTITYLNINISRPSWKNESTVYFISFVYLFIIFVSCSCSYCILSYVYKTQKMHAHWCIYKFIFYIHLIKYLFYISEYKAMLIQLLICHIQYIYIYQKVPIRIPLKYRIDKRYR